MEYEQITEYFTNGAIPQYFEGKYEDIEPIAKLYVAFKQLNFHIKTGGNIWEMFKYYAKFGMGGNPNILTCLLGRNPVDLSGFVQRTLQNLPL